MIRLVALALIALGLPPSAAIAQAPVPTRYFQQVEADNGHTLTMQLAMRRFDRAADGRTVWLAAMVHIGDKSFYKSVQEKLDVLDLVLFEGVRPPGGGRAEFDLRPKDDAAKVEQTQRRIRFLAIASELHRRAHGKLPETIEQLLDGSSARVAEFARANLNDSWEHRLILRLQPPAAPEGEPRLEITSLGADGAPGGDNAAADIRLSDLPPLKPSEIPRPGQNRSLQQNLASALGLSFQLDVMSHDRPNWRSSDLSVDQIQERLGMAGADADALFDMLDGSSFSGGVAKLVLGLIKLFPSARVYGKIALMQAMLRSDDLLVITPRTMAETFDVILNDRNAVVLSDLNNALESEPNLKRIAIIYGGAHMPGIEKGLANLGFKDVAVEWHDAIRLDLKSSGFTPAQGREISSSIGRQLDSQIKAAKRKSRNKKPRKD